MPSSHAAPLSPPTRSDEGELNFTHSEKRNQRRHDEAIEILSLAISLLGKPESVVDVGGGQGAWCQAWNELGVADATCIDHPGAADDGLVIPAENFVGCDLSRDFPTVRSCDWATCFEVAEHLPEARSAALVDYLTSCAGVVLFSAAIPGQPGDHHINCQPASYWKERFAASGFRRLDCLRGRLIDRDLAYWWKQNLFVFTNREDLQVDSGFPAEHGDDVMFVSERMNRIYLDALRVAQTPLKTRVLEAIRSKIGLPS